MPKKNPKRNPVHIERVSRKQGRIIASTHRDGGVLYPDRFDDIDINPRALFGFESPLPSSGSLAGGPRCGLCGKTTNLTKTECCDRWICNDEDQYVLFSYDTNSCHRNHDRYTLCAHHHHEEHQGAWQDCSECREDFETEMYVWYGTNDYNFEKLPNPPAYAPTKCAKCKKVIHLGEDEYMVKGEKYFCERCGGFSLLL